MEKPGPPRLAAVGTSQTVLQITVTSGSTRRRTATWTRVWRFTAADSQQPPQGEPGYPQSTLRPCDKQHVATERDEALTGAPAGTTWTHAQGSQAHGHSPRGPIPTTPEQPLEEGGRLGAAEEGPGGEGDGTADGLRAFCAEEIVAKSTAVVAPHLEHATPPRCSF